MNTVKLIRVDFHSMDEDGLLIALQKHATSTLYVGDMVLAIGTPGHSYFASVVSVEANGIVRLVLDPASWREPVAA